MICSGWMLFRVASVFGWRRNMAVSHGLPLVVTLVLVLVLVCACASDLDGLGALSYAEARSG